jgi:hypothetical protein
MISFQQKMADEDITEFVKNQLILPVSMFQNFFLHH